MGTVLKVIGGLTVFGWIIMAVGCTMLTHAIGQRSGAIPHASARGDVVRALQDGQIDASQLPSDIATAPEATITMRDGSTRTLRDTPEDRIVREMLAAKAAAASSSTYGSGSSYSYRREGTASQPHFKPGEPMVNPNPGSGYDD